MKKKITYISVLLILIFLLPFVFEFSDIPVFKSDKEVSVSIDPGASVFDIADILKENDLIRSKNIFLVRVKLSKYKNSLNYGNFVLNKNMTVGKIIKTLAENHFVRKTVSVTFPEGSSVEQMSLILEEKGITSKDNFLDALSYTYDYEFLKYIPTAEYNYRLQGFLFPDTYEFYADAAPEDIINKMLEEFEKRYLSLTKDFSNIFEVITKASVIEKEAKLEKERPLVAGVINNRIKINMPLQIDACVVYAVTEGRYDISKVYNSHLKTDSLYNTYKHKGLPVGPICNPGITSIEAALKPKKHDFLYYHTDETKNDGSHIFTKTFDEHIETMN